MKEVVVTGVGVVTPIGIGTEAFWDGLMSGRSGAGPITQFDTTGQLVTFAHEIHDFDPSRYMTGRQAGLSARFTQMAIAAGKLAYDSWGGTDDGSPVDPERVGVIIGTGAGGIITVEEEHETFLKKGPRRVSPLAVPKMMLNAPPAAVAMRFGLLGPNYAVGSACATGGHAIGDAVRLIQAGMADAMFAGGAESAVTPTWLAAFARMGVLSRRNDEPQKASRPFDAQRDGFVFGEGAGVVVLEDREVAEKRGAEILASVAGYGASSDAFDLVQPDPLGAERAMRAALDDGRITADEVDYINAHGTSTPYNDRVETQAIKAVFGHEAKRIPISSTKSQIGHLIGAAGAVEAAACVLAIHRGVIPGTINLEEADPDCDLDYVPDGPREAPIRVAISNSFGFGGHNACVAFRAA